jgi:D-alanine-D-alanine ligase
MPNRDLVRVGVLLGGRSSEREVSLASGRQAFYNLDSTKYTGVALFMDVHGRLWRLPEKLLVQNTTTDIAARVEADAERIRYDDLPDLIDVAFVALHGKYGDDGCIQGLLEMLDVPYTGSGVLPCALSLDKPYAHRLLQQAGVEVARELVISEAEWRADAAAVSTRIEAELGWPVVTKPTREGSSIGVSVVFGRQDLASALDAAFAWDNEALIEEKLSGMEFSVIVIGNEDVLAFLPTETTHVHSYLTYDDKYMPGRSQKITPARVGSETLAYIQHEAVRAYKALGFRGYARLDGFLVGQRVLLTDPNSTSGMAPSSWMFHQAAEAGLSPRMLIDRIIQLALEAHSQKRGPL